MKQLAFFFVLKLFLFHSSYAQNWCDTTVSSSKTITLLKGGFKKAAVVDPLIQNFLQAVRLSIDSSLWDVGGSRFDPIDDVRYIFPMKKLEASFKKNFKEKEKKHIGVMKPPRDGDTVGGDRLINVPDTLAYVVMEKDTIILSMRAEYDCGREIMNMLDKGNFSVYNYKLNYYYPYMIRKTIAVRCGAEGKKCICDGGGNAKVYYVYNDKGEATRIMLYWTLRGK